MVRSFVLNEEQRDAINEYLDERPDAMSSQVRQIRLRAKRLLHGEEMSFDAMRADIDLLERLAKLKIPKGRKSADVMASFTISPYVQVLNKFMESGERLSVISGDIPFVGLPLTIRQRLNRLSKRADLPVKASVRNKEVYLERTDI